MAIEDLWDSKIRVWRTEAPEGMHQQARLAHVPVAVPEGLVARVDSTQSLRQRSGPPGEASKGRIMVFADREIEIGDRYIIEVVEGPEAPRMLRVEAAGRPGDHHWELMCTPWVGKIREAEVES